MRNIGAWIFPPVQVGVALSLDGVDYAVVGEHPFPAPGETDLKGIQEAAVSFEPRQARYVRVRAQNQGLCPAWHPGAGAKAWLFVDESSVQ